MNITNIKKVVKRKDFERWLYDLEGVTYCFITNCTYSAHPVDVDFKPYTRIVIAEKDAYGELYTGLKSEASLRKFFPLDEVDPKKSLEQFYSILLLQ